jgi:hypothetical protein
MLIPPPKEKLVVAGVASLRNGTGHGAGVKAGRRSGKANARVISLDGDEAHRCEERTQPV